MFEDLKLSENYDGFLFLARAMLNVPMLKSHHHLELELNLVVQGNITYVVDGRRFTLHQYTMLWFFPDQEHQLVDRSPDAEYYVGVFKPQMIAEACRGADYAELKSDTMADEGLLHRVFPPQSYLLVKQTMDSLMQGSLDTELLNREAGFGLSSTFTYQHGDPDVLNAGLRYLLLICWRLQREMKQSGKAVALHPAVRKALIILSEGETELSNPDLARRCGVSDAYLSRIFHRQVGVPLSRYRNSLRMNNFWQRYQAEGSSTILEAVYAAGFGSYAQFYKVFTQCYGVGPRICFKRQKDLPEENLLTTDLNP